ncbi:MAG: hypothetical protein NTW16_02420, partial [Bacteroidetes bacterium]|nr:hypothetical protein [Bacteroidota bacterium]
MKNFSAILMFFALLSFPLIVFSQTQITLIFVGKDATTQNVIPLDSVNITNLAENCDTSLFGPAPLLSLNALWPVGIGEVNGNKPGAFMLKQNYPNPFHGTTTVSIYREYGGVLNLSLLDGMGTRLAEFHNSLGKGFHSFVVSSSGNKVLVLAVSDDQNNRSIKIISTGQANGYNDIQYLGQTPNVEKKSLKNLDNSGFIYYLGNSLRYTAYLNGYGDQIIIDSPDSDSTYYFYMPMLYLPGVTTSDVTNITTTTATCGGTVTSDGGALVTARGVCWSTAQNPTIADNHTTDGSGTGTFMSNLTGLIPNATLYYVRAYATNSMGIAYGNELSFRSECAAFSAVNILISPSENLVCSGTIVTFTATPVNGGYLPTYQWKVNGNDVSGATNAAFAYIPNNGDAVTCVLTSNQQCVTGNPATSNTVTMTVNPILPVSISIIPSLNPACTGMSVTFTATPTNGGASPGYQWKVNGNNISGATNAVYSYVAVNSDAITCVLTSNALCTTGSPATSNTVIMSLSPLLPVNVSIGPSVNPVCAGTSVTFTATPTNGGASPVYQWKVNGNNISGATNAVYSYVAV